ncbi:7706_t:CDS:2 [Dentiscutata heterogama]|uniref:7706_t:CDS:1 n=1 Tax=Dentiscutata heterogama TaxID=1316150 RepID=A0ACA9LB03_9GLOM|nr:7706_t:CDS:2 [Dentiscutata heterogama]
MEAKKLLLVGLGNYSHPQTRHSIGMLALDYIASHLNLTWTKNKNWSATVTTTTTIYVDPPKRPKIKQKNEAGTNMKKQDKNIISPNDECVLKNGIQKIFDDNVRSEENNNTSDVSKSESTHSQQTTLPKPRYRPKPDPVPLEITLMKPLLLMNVSGKSVYKAIRELKLSPADIIVVHDDMQRELGKISLKEGGSANGHNGIKSVIDALKTNQFRRMRIGIGRPPKEIDDRSHDVISSYVLARITNSEMEFYTKEVFPKCKEQLLKI